MGIVPDHICKRFDCKIVIQNSLKSRISPVFNRDTKEGPKIWLKLERKYFTSSSSQVLHIHKPFPVKCHKLCS